MTQAWVLAYENGATGEKGARIVVVIGHAYPVHHHDHYHMQVESSVWLLRDGIFLLHPLECRAFPGFSFALALALTPLLLHVFA